MADRIYLRCSPLDGSWSFYSSFTLTLGLLARCRLSLAGRGLIIGDQVHEVRRWGATGPGARNDASTCASCELLWVGQEGLHRGRSHSSDDIGLRTAINLLALALSVGDASSL